MLVTKLHTMNRDSKFVFLVIAMIFILAVDAVGSGQNKSPPSQPTNANQAPATKGQAKKMVRVPMLNVPISPKLLEINKRLTMDGMKKELTQKQAKWIERFVTTIKNWLYLVDVVLKMEKFKELYAQHLQKEFDIWITGRTDQAFDMYYKDENNSKAPLMHYKINIYRISVADIALVENFNLKSLEIGFERSKEKLPLPNGQTVYRKDRVYVLELEAEFPILDVKFRHEIVQGKEEGAFNVFEKEELQAVKPGHLRMRMSNVKIYIKVFLTKIDPRFVREDPETKETYYNTKPEILDLKFSISDVELFDPEFQQKPNLPEGYVGVNLPKSRASKILKDFTYFLVLNENEKEFNHRLEVELINRYSRAIMLTNDEMLLGANLDTETAFYSPKLPFHISDEEMVMGYKIFYMSYSLSSFVNACKYFLFKALEFQSLLEDDKEDKDNLTPEQLAEQEKKDEETEKKLVALGEEAEKWMENQVTKAGEGLGIRDDGFDWDEKL